MKQITGKQKITFIVDADGKAKTLRRGGRRGWPMFNDLQWALTAGAKRVAVTVQRAAHGNNVLVRPDYADSFALYVYRDGHFLGRICREVFERIFGPISGDQRFKMTKRVVRQ